MGEVAGVVGPPGAVGVADVGVGVVVVDVAVQAAAATTRASDAATILEIELMREGYSCQAKLR